MINDFSQPKSVSWLINSIIADCRSNIYLKSILMLIMYRFAHYFFSKGKLGKIIGSPIIIIYNFVSSWFLGIEIPAKTNIGYPFVLLHGVGLVINSEAIIGSGVMVRQGCCIGNKINTDGSVSKAPVVGDNVEFGANSQVIGPVVVGDDVKIGAGAVVVDNCVCGKIYVGVPAKPI
jgi:putative colanic acid biosynthesis acetyltransferase WcaB